MRPTKPKEIVGRVAKELDLPEEMVSDVITFYYKAVRDILSNLKTEKLNILGLGIFKVSYWKYGKKIRQLKEIIMNTDPKISIRHAKRVADSREKMLILQSAEQRLKKELAKKYVIREIQEQYDELVAKGEDPFKKLEENLRRISEQDFPKEIRRGDLGEKNEDMSEL